VPAFVTFALATQLALVGFFAAYVWAPRLADVLGRIVYGLGIVAALLAVFLALDAQPSGLLVGPVLYASWAAFGAWVDLIRPIGWRVPPRWSVLVPYVVLLTAALFALWIPLWSLDPVLWIAFGVLYAIHTTLNLSTHVGAGRKGPRPT
jgi:hypothetical protein